MAESGAQAQVAASGPGMWRRERKDQSESRGSILKSKRFDIKWYPVLQTVRNVSNGAASHARRPAGCATERQCGVGWGGSRA